MIAPAARLTDDGDTSANAHPGPTSLLNGHSSDNGEDNLGRDRADDPSDGYICATNLDDDGDLGMGDLVVRSRICEISLQNLVPSAPF